jgi:TatD DNase family protein
MILSDTHAHLDFPEFDDDRQQVIRRATQAGLMLIINIGINLETSRQALRIAEAHPEIYATVGFHPHDALEATPDAIAQLEALIEDSKASGGKQPKVVAIGEVGLDYYRDLSPRPKQQDTFRGMIDLAKRHSLPLVIHTRNAYSDTLSILDEMGFSGGQTSLSDKPIGVFHCFSGDLGFAREVLRRGFHVSFTGNITYKNSNLLGIARDVPLERTLLETDCPFLAPIPHRGKRSEPMMVLSVAKTLAEVHDVPMEQVGEICTRAAYRLFNIPGDL